MKIGILTQPLLNNYGGLLQNYSLQKVLIELGHEVLTININYKDVTLLRKLASILKRTLLKILGKDIILRIYPTNKENQIISQNTQQFIKRNINTTKSIKQKVNEKLLKEYGFNSYIVGSDQVWRSIFSPQQSTFFLDFLEDNLSVRKIAYAASFGISDWEFTGAQTQYFGKLIKLFDAISVREDSAVYLCKKYFNVNASHLLDPTFLLDKEVYMALVKKQNVKRSSGNLFTYILDKNESKDLIIDQVARKYNLYAFKVMPPKPFSYPGKKSIRDCIFPPVEDWIRGFMDAQYVVTDSFHGTVFSIIFNKPFISIGNKERGLTRFQSLLKLFKLEDRLIFSNDDINFESLKDIEWEKINNILSQEKEKSMRFLNEHLKNNKLYYT